MPTFKKPGEFKQKAQAPIGLAGRVNTNTSVQWKTRRHISTAPPPPANFDAVPSSSRAKLPMGIDKQSNAQGTSKSLQRSYSIKSMDSNTDCIVASLDLEGIMNNYETWNHSTVCKQMNSILFKCHLQTIHLKSKNKITDKLISHISCIFIWMRASKWLTLNCCWCMVVFKTVWLCKQIRWIEWFV